MNFSSKYVKVLDSRIHYLEAGEGDPILFLHGIPTSSDVWRQIIPYLSPLGRCIAPDLIGFGRSDKPEITYTIHEHIEYLEAFIETLKLKNMILVMHGFGSIIGFDYAMRHASHCKGLVFYEAFLRSLNETEPSLPLQEQLLSLGNAQCLEEMLLNSAPYIEKMTQQYVMNSLPAEVLAQYSQPFLSKGAGKPVVQHIKELSNLDDQQTLEKIINAYTHKLILSSLPKLMLYSVPGFIMTIAMVMWAKAHLSHLEVIDLGEELHLAQESSPQLMGEAISAWLQALE